MVSKEYVRLLELLVDGQQLRALVGLDVVPGSRVILRPDDCFDASLQYYLLSVNGNAHRWGL